MSGIITHNAPEPGAAPIGKLDSLSGMDCTKQQLLDFWIAAFGQPKVRVHGRNEVFEWLGDYVPLPEPKAPTWIENGVLRTGTPKKISGVGRKRLPLDSLKSLQGVTGSIFRDGDSCTVGMGINAICPPTEIPEWAIRLGREFLRLLASSNGPNGLVWIGNQRWNREDSTPDHHLPLVMHAGSGYTRIRKGGPVVTHVGSRVKYVDRSGSAADHKFYR